MVGSRREAADAAISDYRAIEDTPRQLQAVVEMAAFVARVPLATINLLTTTQQHQIATVGFEAATCRREDSMCAITLSVGGQVVVTDASRDPRFRDNPFVTGELAAVRFYAAQPLITPEGVAIGTLCVFDMEPRALDETQRRTLETLAARIVDILELSRRTRALDASLRRMEELHGELVRSNEHLAAFAGQVSHDLRNPLTTIAASLHLLQEEFSDRPDPSNGDLMTVERALRGTRRMQGLIENLLSFARVGGVLRRENVNLNEVVRGVLQDLEVSLEDAEIEVDQLPPVVGDTTQLRAVMQNLIANAVKFRRHGEAATVRVSGRRDGAGTRIEVADSGIGIAPEDLERVFEPLVRLDESGEGSGIGLSTCRRILQAHGGEVGLEPREGGGTVAWIWLPDE